MSSKTSHLGVMTADDFKNRTKATTNVCGFSSHFKSRGSTMNSIDSALDQWDRICNSGKNIYNESQKLEVLLSLKYSCEHYLADVGGKSTALGEHRKGVVKE